MISLQTIFKPLTHVPRGIPYGGGIHEIPEPGAVVIPLEYPGRILYMPQVKRGDKVRKNQIIARSNLGNCVHASISGVVKAIRTVWTARGDHVPAVVIERGDEPALENGEMIDSGSGSDRLESWVDKLKIMGVISPWTRPGRFHHEETTEDYPAIDTIIVKGVNEEPTVFTFEALLENETDAVKRGLDLLQGILPDAAVHLTVPERLASWAAGEFDGRVNVVPLSDEYKDRIERFAVPRIAKRNIPNVMAYRAKGVAVLPVEYLLTMIDALEGRGPFTHKYATVAGDALSNTVVVRFPIGTMIKTILEDLGLEGVPHSRLLVGGPMKGTAQFTDETPMTKSGHGIYLVSEDAMPSDINLPCINCGRCTRACPANIQVHLIGRYVEHDLFLDAKRLHPEACNECGLCAYVCPAHRPLVQLVRLSNEFEEKSDDR